MSELFQFESFATPIGTMCIVTDEQGQLRAADWEDMGDRMYRLLGLHYGEDLLLQPRQSNSRARLAMESYFEGDLGAIEAIRTSTRGTEFQRQVWAALRKIPAGGTMSYGELARKIGRPSAVRAVGAANGANPIPVVVPCHRVIGADASLTGFGGGLERKRRLLAHERRYAAATVPFNLELSV
jgi:methylated-DNA-[protein]-cysteine S-methyltransferase